MNVRKLEIGREQAPLLVIDDFADAPDELVKQSAARLFRPIGRFFPGIRAKAPLSYQRFLLERLRGLLGEFFGLDGRSLKLSMCHYSLVTTPSEKLVMEQRIPHLDSVDGTGLACIHYLFRKQLGGTAFYRHRRTGCEYVDASRKDAYFRALEEDVNGPHAPGPQYINGDTPLFEQIERQDGLFNRILIYRKNSLHSGCIDESFAPDANPLTGRLSINSFIDVQP